jgi:hypothetical protein
MALCVNVESDATTIARCYDGGADFQEAPGPRERPILHFGSGGWVYTGRSPDGARLVIYDTKDTVPPALARRLPKMAFPNYSQERHPTAPGKKWGPGA